MTTGTAAIIEEKVKNGGADKISTHDGQYN